MVSSADATQPSVELIQTTLQKMKLIRCIKFVASTLNEMGLIDDAKYELLFVGCTVAAPFKNRVLLDLAYNARRRTEVYV